MPCRKLHTPVARPASRTAREHTSRFARLTVAAFLCLIAGSALIAAPATAQEVGRLGQVVAEGVPYFTYAREGVPTIQVYAIGAGGTGIYEVEAGTRLDELYVLSTGALRVPSGQERRDITIRLYRDDGGRRMQVYEKTYADFIADPPSQHPSLQDQDVLEVDVRTRQRFGWRDGLSILTSAATIVLLLDRLGDGL